MDYEIESNLCYIHGCDKKPLLTSTYCPKCEYEDQMADEEIDEEDELLTEMLPMVAAPTTQI